MLPVDPAARARARLFADVASTKFGNPLLFRFLRYGESKDVVLAGLEELQALLPANAEFAVGDKLTIADAALAPLLWRFEICLKHELGTYPYGEGRKTLEVYEGGRFEKIRTYFKSVKARQSFKLTISNEVSRITIGTVIQSISRT